MRTIGSPVLPEDDHQVAGLEVGAPSPRSAGCMMSSVARRTLLSNSGGVAFLSATVIANLSNFVFHVVMSRLLGAAAYSSLGAVLTIMVVFSVPVAALQTAMTRDIAELASQGSEVPRIAPVLRRIALVALVASLVVLAAAPAFGWILNLNGGNVVPALAAFIPATFLGLAPRALLLGRERFRPVASSIVGGTSVRLAVGLILVALGGSEGHAMAAVVIGEWAATAILLFAARSNLTSRRGPTLQMAWREQFQAMSALGGLWLLVGIDVVLARHYLPADASGQYTAAATLGRGGLFLAVAMATMALPRFSGVSRSGARAALRRALAGTVVLVGLAAGVFIAAPDLLVGLVYGPGYLRAADVVPRVAVVGAVLGLASVLVYFHLARRSAVSQVSWIGVGVASAMAVAWHATPTAIAGAAGAGAITTLVLSGLAVVADKRDLPHRERRKAPWQVTPSELDLSVVVPYYNPGPELRANIERLVQALRDTDASFEIIPVSDGSTDGSEITIGGFDLSIVRPIVLDVNCGKGEALRVGLSQARGRYLGFIDADGDIDPNMWASFMAVMRTYQPDVILGSKRHPLSEVSYPPLRRFMSWGYQQLIRVLFHLNVRDTQTGIKLARREVIAGVLPRMLEKRFAFDLELLVVARRLGYRRLFEVPVRIDYQFTSTISTGAVWKTMLDTLAIFYRLRIRRYYDRSARPEGALWVRPNFDEAAA